MRREAPASSDKALLYEQVIGLVEKLVVERGLSPGDLLPTQAELGKLAGVSRITVTRALTELEREGRVRRHQGIGTFLSQPRIVSEPARTGSLLGTLSSAASHMRLMNTVLGLAQGLPSPDLARVLDLGRRARVWQLRRVRLLEGRAIVAETSIIPVALAPDLDRFHDELSGSLYELLEEKFSLKDTSEEQYLEVASPTAEHRRLLSLSAQASVVRIRGLSSDTSGRPFDCFEQVYPSTDFLFYLSGGESRQLLVSSATKDWSVVPLEGRPESAEPTRLTTAKKRAAKKS